MYSIALGPRCLKWKMLSLSGPNALLFLHLLIALLTRSTVNVCAISKDFLYQLLWLVLPGGDQIATYGDDGCLEKVIDL